MKRHANSQHAEKNDVVHDASSAPVPRDIELKQDLGYQRIEWLLQRAGWFAMAAIVLGGSIGLLGRGPLSAAASADVKQLLRIDYNRFARCCCSTAIEITATGEAVRDGELRLKFDESFFAGTELRSVAPAPVRVELDNNQAVYVFRVLDASRPTRVVLHLEPSATGLQIRRIGVFGEDLIPIPQFIYP
jgi:hypothetical protein